MIEVGLLVLLFLLLLLLLLSLLLFLLLLLLLFILLLLLLLLFLLFLLLFLLFPKSLKKFPSGRFFRWLSFFLCSCVLVCEGVDVLMIGLAGVLVRNGDSILLVMFSMSWRLLGVVVVSDG